MSCDKLTRYERGFCKAVSLNGSNPITPAQQEFVDRLTQTYLAPSARDRQGYESKHTERA
jgi:hypothetical protein